MDLYLNIWNFLNNITNNNLDSFKQEKLLIETKIDGQIITIMQLVG